DEEPEAVLRIPQLALEAVALAHVAHGSVGAGEAAALVAGGERDELRRDRVAVAVQEVDPAAQLAVLRALAQAGGPVDLRDLPRALMDQRPEVLAEEVFGPPAGEPLARVGHEREPGV